MKKLLLALGSILLVGAGCFGGKTLLGGVEGDWWLSFSLPEGWVMTRDYTANDPTSKLNRDLDSTLSDIMIQSTDKLVLSAGQTPDLSQGLTADQFVSENYTRIRVFHLDSHSIIPSEATDMGNGFKKLDLCAGTETCTLEGSAQYAYYFEQDGEKFKFTLEQNGQSIESAETVLTSAKLVTEFQNETKQ
ncbi:MAG: hypothetical protein WCT24_00215 [Patescibacteria group bacterium]